MLLSELKLNPDNPRRISKTQYEKLKKSLRDFPEMLEKRPIVYDDTYTVLGGNMRLRALRDLVSEGFEVKDSYFVSAEGWSDEKKKEFIIKDNVELGEWDDDILANEWANYPLSEWGLDIEEPEDDFYTRDVKAPIYEPKNEKPDYEMLVDKTKAIELLKDIEEADIDEKDKEFLRLGAYRHYVFDYAKIADFYAHSPKKVQELMEDSALVIIDFKKAIENGYVRLIEDLMTIQEGDYGK